MFSSDTVAVKGLMDCSWDRMKREFNFKKLGIVDVLRLKLMLIFVVFDIFWPGYTLMQSTSFFGFSSELGCKADLINERTG